MKNPYTDAALAAAWEAGFKAAKPKAGTWEGFDEFYAAYPRKVGKFEAQKAWAAKKPPQSEVMEALAWQILSTDHLAKDDKSLIPHPATWINGGRWLDEKPYSRAQVAREAKPVPQACPHYDITTAKRFGVKDGVPMVKLQDTCKCGHAFAPAYHSAEDLRTMLKYAPTLTATKDLLRELEAYAAKGGA